MIWCDNYFCHQTLRHAYTMVHGVACGKTLILYASLIQADTMSAYSSMDFFDADLLASRKEERRDFKNILQREIDSEDENSSDGSLTDHVDGQWWMENSNSSHEELIA